MGGDPAQLSGGDADAILDVVVRALCKRVLDGGASALAVVFVQKLAQRGPGDDAPAGKAENARGALAQRDLVGGDVPGPVAEMTGRQRELQALVGCAQRRLRLAQRLLGPLPRLQHAPRVLQADRAQQLVFVVVRGHGATPSTRAAMRVPSTRAAIFAKATSRLVDVSSLKGEKPQSSVVPNRSMGM